METIEYYGGTYPDPPEYPDRDAYDEEYDEDCEYEDNDDYDVDGRVDDMWLGII